MEKYTDHNEWKNDLQEAEKRLEELRRVEPTYYAFYMRLLDAKRNGWRFWGLDSDPHREKTQTVNRNAFDELMKEWSDLPATDSEKVWELVKDANEWALTPEQKFDTGKMYAKIKALKEEKNA